MKKYLKVILPIILVLTLGFIVFHPKIQSIISTDKNINQEVFANLVIDTESGSQSFDISSFVGKTALIATQAKTSVITNGTGVNAFVTSINGRAADTMKREFWELDVNGREAEVGAGTYIIKDHDEIKWKITNY